MRSESWHKPALKSSYFMPILCPTHQIISMNTRRNVGSCPASRPNFKTPANTHESQCLQGFCHSLARSFVPARSTSFHSFFMPILCPYYAQERRPETDPAPRPVPPRIGTPPTARRPKNFFADLFSASQETSFHTPPDPLRPALPSASAPPMPPSAGGDGPRTRCDRRGLQLPALAPPLPFLALLRASATTSTATTTARRKRPPLHIGRDGRNAERVGFACYPSTAAG